MFDNIPTSDGLTEELRASEERARAWFVCGTPVILLASIAIGVALAWLN